MMPASRVLPVILIPGVSNQHRAVLAQKAEQLDERQAKNGKVVAGNPREQLHASPLKAIGTDRSEQHFALGSDIPRDEGIAEPPHVHFRRTRSTPKEIPAAHDDRSGLKPV